ncbi:MAG: putative iron-sulfur cluster-binding metallochaperone [bacterium]
MDTARMSSCCCAAAHGVANDVAFCPLSGTKGSSVERQTVKAVLTSAALRTLTEATYRFCPDPACDVVYFADDGQTYSKADLQVKVWQKEPYGARVICYCFGENETDIRVELNTNGKSEAVERVRADITAGRCACDIRNPRGACCLGDISAAVRRVAESLEPATAEVSG